MTRIILVLLATTRIAAATPLEPLWETKVKCDTTDLVPWGTDSLAWLAGGKVQRVDRATGKLGKPVTLAKLAAPKGPSIGWSDAARLEAVIGDALVIHGGHFFAVLDAATGKLRWQADQGHDAGLPTLHAAGGDLVWVHPSSLGKGDAAGVDRLAIATGAVVWHATAVPDSGQVEWSQVDDKRLYLMTRPDAIGPRNVLAAFDLATGKRLWSQDLTGKAHDQGSGGIKPLLLALAGTAIVYANGDVPIHVLDAATGAARPDIALPAAATGLVADATHVYAKTAASIVAVDTVKHAAQWTQQRTADRLLAVTPAALYIVTNEFQIVRALDLHAGGELASYGVAGTNLDYTAADSRAPTFVACDDGKRLVALDPTGTALPTEHAKLTGTLACANCGKGKKVFPPTDVAIGDATAKTDKAGKFTIELDARGALNLSFGLPELESPIGWTGATDTVVRFKGKGKYALGTLTVRVDCGPLEPPCQ